MLKLVNDTITSSEIDHLCDWLKTYPQLTKGKMTEDFEQQWSYWLGCKYSVFVNSGSSANLMMVYAGKISNLFKNNTIIVPSLCWATTISPFIQLGYDLILCETDKSNLGIDPNYFETLCQKYNPGGVILTHILGFSNSMKEILEICAKHNIPIIEDTCESVGTITNNKLLGSFGSMSSFSTYFGHHFSTIEGGIVSTNDFDLYELLKSIRSHGWSRDLSDITKNNLRTQYNIDSFNDMYTFYYPGFNFRSTDLQAFLGISQLTSLNTKNKRRFNNLLLYDSLIDNPYWKIEIDHTQFISNFAYPIIHPKKNQIIEALKNEQVECRPLVCGNMARQPFFYKRYGHHKLEFADIVHEYGLYVPNNPDLNEQDIIKISNIINTIIHG